MKCKVGRVLSLFCHTSMAVPLATSSAGASAAACSGATDNKRTPPSFVEFHCMNNPKVIARIRTIKVTIALRFTKIVLIWYVAAPTP